MRLKGAFAIIIILLILLLPACREADGGAVITEFVERTYCFDSGSGLINLTFYTNGESSGVWAADKIISVEIVSENKTLKASISQLDVDGSPLYSAGDRNYYHGMMAVEFSGLDASLGLASLKVNFVNGDTKSFPIGQIGYLADPMKGMQPAGEEDYFRCFEYGTMNAAVYLTESGVLKIPAIAVNVSVLEHTTIASFDMGLNNIGLDAANAIVYTEEEYQSAVSEPLEKMELDKVIPGVYDNKETGAVNGACGITLEPGVYFIILPVVTVEGAGAPKLIHTGIDIEYISNDKKGLFHIQCNPLYMEYFHVEEEVLSLFKG